MRAHHRVAGTAHRRDRRERVLVGRDGGRGGVCAGGGDRLPRGRGDARGDGPAGQRQAAGRGVDAGFTRDTGADAMTADDKLDRIEEYVDRIMELLADNFTNEW